MQLENEVIKISFLSISHFKKFLSNKLTEKSKFSLEIFDIYF